MTARQVDEARKRLHELRAQTIEDMVLAAVALAVALAASQLWPALTMPFLLGAMGVAFLGMRAFVHRSLLVEDLAADDNAYVIPDVREFALRAASPEHRQQLAHSVRVALTGSSCQAGSRLAAVRDELEQLIAALEEDGLRWEPQVAVALERWLDDPAGSFRDRSAPVAELRSRLRSVLAQVRNQ